MLAVTLTVLSTTGTVDDSEGSPSYYIGLLIFVIFVVDFLLRLFCYYLIHGRVDGFAKNTFNQIDFVVVAIDVVFLALPDGGDDSSSAQYTKVLRLVRTLRLFKLLRLRACHSCCTMFLDEQANVYQPMFWKHCAA